MERLACSLDPGRSLDEGVERVRLSESLGYESVWVTHIATREPMQVLAHYAHHTDRIGLATGVVPIALRHPALLAMEAATLDEVSGGRLTLGIGVSHRTTVEGWYGLSLDDPVGRMREYATILRQVFEEGSAGVEGKHYTARFGFIRYRPRPDTKLFFAALGPRMLRLAAELADGVVLWMCSPEYVREVVRPTLGRALEEHGRAADGFEVVANVACSLTEDVGAGRDAFRRRAMPYLQLPFYRKAIAAAGNEGTLEAFDEAMGAGTPEALRAVPDGFVDEYAAVGDADAIRAKLQEYRDAGVTVPAVGPMGAHDGALGVEATLKAAAE